MGSVCSAFSAGCTLLSCCVGGAASAGNGSGKVAKVGYLFTMMFCLVLSFVLKYWGGNLTLNMLNWQIGCVADPSTTTPIPIINQPTALACMGDAAVLRISFILAGWFLLIMLACVCINKKAHVGCWGIKLLVLFGSIVASFWAPNTIFDNSGYAWPARIISGLFLLLQVVMFIDFAYAWNESWVKKAVGTVVEGEDRKWYGIILGCAASIYLTSFIVLIVLLVMWGGCGTNALISIATLIQLVCFTGLQLKQSESNGSVLSSAVVTGYITYLAWSAQNSNPVDGCGGGSGGQTWQIIVGVIVSAFSLAWTVFSASNNGRAVFSGGEEPESALEKPLQDGSNSARQYNTGASVDGGDVESPDTVHATRAGDELDRDEDERKDSEGSNGEAEDGEERYWFFHLIMFTGAVYMSMLLTDWGSGYSGSTASSTVDRGSASMWVKFISQMMVSVLYSWSLVAPKFLTNRSFD